MTGQRPLAMEASLFKIQLVNGVCGDPAVYITPPAQRTAVLFDCGSLENLSHRQILRAAHICISHCHVDHFIGFDRIIRHAIPRFRPVNVHGPEGLADRLSHRLRSYTWNLLEEGQLTFLVKEVDVAGAVRSFRLVNQAGFLPEMIGEQRQGADGVVADLGVLEPSGLKLSATILDHGIAVAAFRLDLPVRYPLDLSAVEALGLVPGPWIAELKKAVFEGDSERLVSARSGTGTMDFRACELSAKVLLPARHDSLGYVTDVAFHEANLRRAGALLRGVGSLICECCFKDEHADRATARRHLTTRQAAALARLAGARALIPFHVSNIYSDDPDAVVLEAQGFFHHNQ